MRPKPLNPGTQNYRIQRYLARGRSLTQIQALQKFKCMRLAPRITELKRKHYRIRRRMIDLPNGKTVAQYFTPPARR